MTHVFLEDDCERCGQSIVDAGAVCSPVRAGGYYEDETGWWAVDAVDADGTVWLIDRDGDEWQTTIDRLPPLTYAD